MPVGRKGPAVSQAGIVSLRLRIRYGFGAFLGLGLEFDLGFDLPVFMFAATASPVLVSCFAILDADS
jgi:hypothetical protein